MPKRTLLRIFLTTFALLLLCCLPALAVSGSDFDIVKTYQTGIYNDIQSSDWFYADVVYAYERGFITSTGNQPFDQSGAMNIASVLALACRIRASYEGAAAPQNGSTLWYTPYVEYALAKGIIRPGDFTDKYDNAATRGEAAYIFAHTLPEQELTPINTLYSIPDVARSHRFFAEIISLYRAGIATGDAAEHNFAPDEKLTRAAAVSLAAKLTDSARRTKAEFAVSADEEALAKLANFGRQKQYAPGIFTDISQNDWYYENIVKCYEYGLATGMGEGLFQPDGSISIASVITLACRIHACYNSLTAPQNGKDIWYQTYVEYAIGQNIIKASDFSGRYTQNATRAEVAYILANTLPDKALPKLVSNSYLPDVSNECPYFSAILALYNKGIVTGKDSAGDFFPQSSISRAEVMTMICRMLDESARQTIIIKAPKTESETIAEILRLVNAYRAAAGADAVLSFPVINQAAQTRAQEISVQQGHLRPDDRDFYTVLEENSIKFFQAAENIACGGAATPAQLIYQFINDADSLEVILYPDFSMMGIGHFLTSYGMNCWALMFVAS